MVGLPLDFNVFEHLQSTIKKPFNKEVREAFNDLGGDEWLPDINTPRASLRQACTMYDSDTATMMALKMMFFYFTLTECRAEFPNVP